MSCYVPLRWLRMKNIHIEVKRCRVDPRKWHIPSILWMLFPGLGGDKSALTCSGYQDVSPSSRRPSTHPSRPFYFCDDLLSVMCRQEAKEQVGSIFSFTTDSLPIN